MNSLEWLLDSDPSIRWQALRDLTEIAPDAIAAERSLISREGLGAVILAAQQADGSWRGEDAPAWLTTLFTLQLLRATGVERADRKVEAAIARLESQLRWDSTPGNWDLRPVKSGNPFFQGEVEPCINGGVLALGGYFGRPNEALADRLLGEQLPDGGWNCDAPKSKCASFHTTICVLEGLLEYEHATGASSGIRSARRRAEEYLLERALFRRRSTGEIANPEFLELAFSPRYHYDVLRALDYFRAAGAEPDPRMNEAVLRIKDKRQAEGRWLLENCYSEALALPLNESIGEPSRWITLRAMRVLRWYNGEVSARTNRS